MSSWQLELAIPPLNLLDLLQMGLNVSIPFSCGNVAIVFSFSNSGGVQLYSPERDEEKLGLESLPTQDSTPLHSVLLFGSLSHFSDLFPWGAHPCDCDSDQQHREDCEED